MIRCHGPRLIDTWNGINFALEHDLCICRCSTPPTLLARQQFSSQDVDGPGFDPAAAAVAVARQARAAESDEAIVSQHFELTDGDGHPVDGYRYDLYKDGVLFIRNAALDGGRTAAVAGDAELRLVMWTPDSGGRA